MAEPDGNSAAMLSALHKMRMICAHPLVFSPQSSPDESPKVQWLLSRLRLIRDKQEKVIIFTEFREIQTFLQLTVFTHFGINVTVINGDTNANSEKGASRQKLIDLFQNTPGFNVIILSTTAVGFGVNVQAANHVIHYTRCWNPAKEDQATDRAYRIGQQRDVTVYYPTIHTSQFDTFEVKLDRLLTSKRKLAGDMLNGTGEISIKELADEVLR
jgi:SNF2 family DNA or RNA helicase